METAAAAVALPPARRAQWILVRTIRWGVHAGALLGAFLVGFSWPAGVALAAGTLLGAFGVTRCYHRYFAHKSFRTTRWFQFLHALWGATSLQRGPNGFYRWEIDLTFYAIKLLELVGPGERRAHTAPGRARRRTRTGSAHLVGISPRPGTPFRRSDSPGRPDRDSPDRDRTVERRRG